MASYMRVWRKENQHHVKAYKAADRHKRRALMANAIPSWFGELDELVMAEAVDVRNARFRLTGFKWEIDHIVPIQCKEACGLHCWSNIQVIPGLLNTSKGNRLKLLSPQEWLWLA
jgi:hypothetical protein